MYISCSVINILSPISTALGIAKVVALVLLFREVEVQVLLLSFDRRFILCSWSSGTLTVAWQEIYPFQLKFRLILFLSWISILNSSWQLAPSSFRALEQRWTQAVCTNSGSWFLVPEFLSSWVPEFLSSPWVAELSLSCWVLLELLSSLWVAEFSVLGSLLLDLGLWPPSDRDLWLFFNRICSRICNRICGRLLLAPSWNGNW